MPISLKTLIPMSYLISTIILYVNGHCLDTLHYLLDPLQKKETATGTCQTCWFEHITDMTSYQYYILFFNQKINTEMTFSQ